MVCVKCGKEAPDAPFCALCGWKQSKPVERRTRRGNGQGYVYKRGNIWYAQITLYSTSEVVDGKKVYRRKTRTKGGFKTKKDALNHIANLSTNQGRRMPTLLELYTQFEKTDLPKLSKDKQSSYKKARERIDALMGREIDSLTVAEMQQIVDEKATSHYTARDIKTLFSKLYQKAMPDRYVTVNLSQYIVLPELNEAEATPFSSEEVQKIWDAFTDGSKIAGDMLVMIYTGMMPGELFSCQKDMIDYDKCEIYGCGKKTKKRKEVPIVFPDFLAPVIEFIASESDSEKLVPCCDSHWYEEYHKLTKRIGIRDLPPYSCRHTTGTEAAKLNLSAPIIQNLMRHSRITTTQRYIHLGAVETHAAVNQMQGKTENAY